MTGYVPIEMMGKTSKLRVKMYESIEVNVWHQLVELDGYRVAFC